MQSDRILTRFATPLIAAMATRSRSITTSDLTTTPLRTDEHERDRPPAKRIARLTRREEAKPTQSPSATDIPIFKPPTSAEAAITIPQRENTKAGKKSKQGEERAMARFI